MKMLEISAASAIVGIDNHHHHVGETKPYKITTEEKLQRIGIKRGIVEEEIDGNSINSAIATAGYTIAACPFVLNSIHHHHVEI